MFNKKEKIFIFGTGAGGRSFYKKFSRKYNVIGFIDNNIQRHGKRLFSKNIYPPSILTVRSFDWVVIVSDYYVDICNQLKNEINIDEGKFRIFSAMDLRQRNFIEKMNSALDASVNRFICSYDSVFSRFIFSLKYFFLSKTDDVELVSLDWLDQREDLCVYTLRDEKCSQSFGPKFVGSCQRRVEIKLPKISLYEFSNAQICSVSRSILDPSGHIIVERVQTALTDIADYSGGHLICHGNKMAIVRREDAIGMEKGIVISGNSETNYYHWMLEILPQFQFINELPIKYSDYPILISAHSQKIPSIKKFIDILNIKRDIVFLDSTSSYIIQSLLFINTPNNSIPNLKNQSNTKVNFSYVRKESLVFLRDVAYQYFNIICRNDSRGKKRVFFARKGIIRSYNQDEIIQGLIKLNFLIVYMEDLSFEEQVILMSEASMIVGASGAAWTNLLFAQEGTKALCWMADKVGEASGFSNIAHFIGVDMDCIKYPVVANDTRDLYSASYHIRPDVIFEWVDENS
ncbi:glycosyltransferase family 61 protein [Aeromonas schubertii]|uniref:glycosyltransferase family 61 protein n=1 Tax=Aeromonas schubertii TaxID=652 RepID=UPI001CC81444|nr:glycosyltransferase family 61 protein [Aeromonas schubertii]MBZ6071650.1 glycosyltransferase family 61 protein [Aeromonas schubertii]